MAINTPVTSDSIYKYGGHTPDNLGTINNTGGIIAPHIQEGGALPNTVEGLQTRYNWDVHDAVSIRHREEFPMLALADANGSTHNMTTYIMSDDDDADFTFPATLINDLRLRDAGATPIAIGGSGEIGGKMAWFKGLEAGAVAKLYAAGVPVAAAQQTTTALVTKATALNEKALESYGTDKVLALGCKLDSEKILGGTPTNFIIKMIALLKGNAYTSRTVDTAGTLAPLKDTAGGNYYTLFHNPTSKSVMIPFPDLAFNIDGVDYQEHEVLVRLESFWYNVSCDEFVLVLNFSKTNMKTALGTVNTILLEEMQVNATVVTSGFTRFDTCAVLGHYNTIPDPVMEGSDTKTNLQTGFQYAFETRENYMQIFRADPIEVTGTRLATGNYRIDDVKRNRDKMLRFYKRDKTNAFMWGKKKQSRDSTTGKSIRSCSGIFDYELNPIKYIRATLNRYGAANFSLAIDDYLKGIAYSLNAFKHMTNSGSVIDILASTDMLMALDLMAKMSYGQSPNAHGYTTQQPYTPNSVDFSIKHFDYITAYGTLRFTREPALDYMTEFALPSFMQKTAVNPKNIMIAINRNDISTKVLRGDKLQGNLQGNGEDLSREDIIGEATISVNNTRDQAIIITDIV